MTPANDNVKLLQGDCLELMKALPDASVDLILCDLPYGTTSCAWDSIIPFDMLWAEYLRIAKPNAAIVLTASQPFTSALVMSRADIFKYSWSWVKTNCSGFANAKKQPLRSFEDVAVFYRKQPTYNPQGVIRLEKARDRTKATGEFMGRTGFRDGYAQEFTNYPKNVLNIASERGLHPTQKPVDLMEYLVRTYTNEGDLVLDNCMGSGTTGVACANTGRRFIGMEMDAGYFAIAQGRIMSAVMQPDNDNERQSCVAAA
jgi:site-specific DNA-methyltransferase (adenine-specific)